MSDLLKTQQVIPKILVGTDDFHDLLLNSDIFVDKTLLIKTFVENSDKVVLITRPRRWGKSMNLDMIAKFLQIELDKKGNRLSTDQRVYDKLFTGGELELGFPTGKKKRVNPLKIAQYQEVIEDYQGKFPVIKLGFKDVKGNSYQEIASGVNLQVKMMFAEYEYLMRSNLLDDIQRMELKKYLTGNIDLVQLKNSIKFLSDILNAHFGVKVYILVDEYDTPINTAYVKFYENRKEEFQLVTDLFHGIFGAALKGNTSLKKGLITGILRVAKANIFSGLNNLVEDCLLDKEFAQYYGFTEEEVENLLTRACLDNKLGEVKKWYNGYHMGGEIIYNPWSIMQCIRHKGACDTYWLDSGGTALLDKVLLSDKVQEELQLLLEDKPLVKRVVKHIAFDEFESSSSIFYSLLLFAGYLNAKPENSDEYEQVQKYVLSIPNLELKNVYIDRVTTWISRKLQIPREDYYGFIDLLLRQKLDQFMEQLNIYLISSTSFHDLVFERDYHNLMGGIFFPLLREYFVSSNKESGLGRYDHILVPRKDSSDTAFIFEYKVSKNKKRMNTDAKNALSQIEDKHYHAEMKNYGHVKNTIKVGMAFYGKEFRVFYNVTSDKML